LSRTTGSAPRSNAARHHPHGGQFEYAGALLQLVERVSMDEDASHEIARTGQLLLRQRGQAVNVMEPFGPRTDHADDGRFLPSQLVNSPPRERALSRHAWSGRQLTGSSAKSGAGGRTGQSG
jgi:hypothetical protein